MGYHQLDNQNVHAPGPGPVSLSFFIFDDDVLLIKFGGANTQLVVDFCVERIDLTSPLAFRPSDNGFT